MKINAKLIRLGLCVLGNLGVPLTSYISIKCHEKAKNAKTKKEKLKCYLPAIISGTATIGCNIGSYHAGSKEIAALTATATYAVANRSKIEEELKKVVGEERTEEIKKTVKDDIVKDKRPEPFYEETGFGKLKVIEGFSGRFFKSSYNKVLSAESSVNDKLIRGDWVSLNDFYRYLGIAQDEFGEEHIWIPRDEVYPKWYEDNPIGFDNRIIEGDDGEMSLIIDICNYPTNIRKAV